MNKIRVSILLLLATISCTGQPAQLSKVIVGAQQTASYFPLLRHKNVALVANQTSMVGNAHLVDTLLASNINLVKVFAPEHGFREMADAGKTITNSVDAKTGLPIVSLYGQNKKPSLSDLAGIDLVVFDIQDVGVRFYTYISTLHYIMEACAEQGIPVLVLDRPNPNGFYVDGPVLDSTARSFVGMHPVPLVHGLTIAEFALMINGEKWLANKVQCDLLVVTCQNYNHNLVYDLPVKPSPNLPNLKSVLLYPALGLFEGTIISVGRGTPFPFQVYGHPDYKAGKFEFTPQPTTGAQFPKYNEKRCFGADLRTIPNDSIVAQKRVNLEYLMATYQYFKATGDYFNNFFYRLAGTQLLRQQIEQGLTEHEIRVSWQPALDQFKPIRKKYLLYPDYDEK